MTDYFSKLNNSQPITENAFYNALVEASEQFTAKYTKSHKLAAYVSTRESSFRDQINLVFTIMTLDNNSPYYYSLINVDQVIGNISQAKVQSFTNPPTDKLDIEVKDFDNYLINDVFGSLRFKVVIDMVSQMGKTITSWE